MAVLIQATEAPWPETNTNPVALGARGLSTVAGVLVLIGLPVLAARFANRSAWLAVLGLVAISIDILVYDVFKGLLEATLSPYLAANNVGLWRDMSTIDPVHASAAQPLALLILLLLGGVCQLSGGLMFGLAALRSHAVSRLAAGLLIGSSVLFLGAFGPPDGPLGDWPDLASTLALLAGLGLAGVELLGVRPRTRERTLAAGAAVRT